MEDEEKRHAVEVWSMLDLCRADRDRIADFLVTGWGVPADKVVQRMHITVYHARRPMPGLSTSRESVNVEIPVAETRMMVMAPGGENPRPELHPGRRKVGVRVQRQGESFQSIMGYRNRLLALETREVLGSRKPSTHRANAFGARSFQAHMSILLAGSGIGRDLKPLGVAFRQAIGTLRFDQFRIAVRSIERNV